MFNTWRMNVIGITWEGLEAEYCYSFSSRGEATREIVVGESYKDFQRITAAKLVAPLPDYKKLVKELLAAVDDVEANWEQGDLADAVNNLIGLAADIRKKAS